MRTRKWIAIAGEILGDVFEWEDGNGHFGRCLRVKTENLKQKVSSLENHVVVITGYYPQKHRNKELGVLVDIKQACAQDYGKHYSALSEERVRDIAEFKCRLEEDEKGFH